MSTRGGAARREVLAHLCPAADLVVDIGADHGHVAHAVCGVATERRPHRSGRPDVPWVVADGLSPFRHVPVAIIAGMGARLITRILERGPRPDVAILHAADDPPHLRRWLAAHGWRIDAEALAPEANRWAEVIRAVPGEEPARGLHLEFGPLLLASADPHLRAHLEHHRRHHVALAAITRGRAPEKHASAHARAEFLAARLAERGWR